MQTYKRVLTIAGSDSGGGAGIQADIKAISANACFASSAITAITAQNTMGVKRIQPVQPEMVKRQITAVLSDIGADAVKIGMLHNSETIISVHEVLKAFGVTNIILDPVMIATSGHQLLQNEAIKTLRTTLLPMARVITPNIPEAEILLDEKIKAQKDFVAAAKALSVKNNHVSVFLKAGHMEANELTDVFYNAEMGESTILRSHRIHTVNTHGTGCTLSAAFAAFVAQGFSLNAAAEKAQAYINKAIREGALYKIGEGHGPVKHFFDFW